MILVGAFEPFAGRRVNRALAAARRLDGAEVAGARVRVEALPVEFAALPRSVDGLLARRPRALLLVGESSHARTLLVEQVALNVAHARIADNAGARPRATELVPGGALAHRVRLDVIAIAGAVARAGVPCEASWHAGTFCCNAALYHALDRTRDGGSAPSVAFVHVPARRPWANDARAARGLATVLSVLLHDGG